MYIYRGGGGGARRSGLNLVYLYETWINIHHTYFKEWMKDDVARVVPTGRGERLILLHAIDKNQGFLPGCQLLFKSISTDGRDYHTEMNGVIFEDWLKNKLLPALPEPSLIIMDNAPYHKRQDGTPRLQPWRINIPKYRNGLMTEIFLLQSLDPIHTRKLLSILLKPTSHRNNLLLSS